MADSLISNMSNVPSFSSGARAKPDPSSTLSLQQSLTPIGISKNKESRDKALSENIETVLNSLSSNVSSGSIKAEDSSDVESIEQDIGSILSLAKNNEGMKAKQAEGGVGTSIDSSQSDDFTAAAKQGIVDILSIASDVLELQTDAGLDESYTLSLIADLLAMLEDLMGVTDLSMQNGSGSVTSQERFNLLIEYIDLVQDDLIASGDSRFSDVISLVDQQLEEQRYRDRESMKGLSLADYLKRKGGTY